MKKTLIEELERIHTITYGNEKLLNEGFLDKLLDKFGLKHDEKKVDNPRKADNVSPDVADFFNTLETAARSGGLSQQTHGDMRYQKSVESLQIGLSLLGYPFERYGIDGLFGPETAQAVAKFKNDNSILNEGAEEIRSTLNSLGYKEKNGQLSGGGEISDELSAIVSRILKDYKAENPNVNVMVTAGNDEYHKGLNYNSKHKTGQAIDLTISPYDNNTSTSMVNLLKRYSESDNKFSFKDEYKNPSKAATGKHYHLEYGNKPVLVPQNAKNGMITATPEMLAKLVEILKGRNLKPENLVTYIDGGGSPGEPQDNTFITLDMDSAEGYHTYSEVCQKFINSRQPNPLNITGDMMARAAKNTYDRYHKFVPAELALAQMVLEGGIGNGDLNSRPIKTKNPFNVGNVDSDRNSNQSTVEAGIQEYYDLIAKSYLNKGRNANDLVRNFVNSSDKRYASSQNYEARLNSIIPQINKMMRGSLKNVA